MKVKLFCYSFISDVTTHCFRHLLILNVFMVRIMHIFIPVVYGLCSSLIVCLLTVVQTVTFLAMLIVSAVVSIIQFIIASTAIVRLRARFYAYFGWTHCTDCVKVRVH